MQMNWQIKFSFSSLLLFLLVSIGLNIFLFLQGRIYYLDLNSTRLDPLGINTYFTEAPQYPMDKPLVVFFGDSRAAGWTVPSTPEMTFVNRGIGAQTTSQALGRFTEHVQPLQADIIVIQVGINDLKTIPLFPDRKKTIVATCEANIQKIVEKSVQNGSQVILTTIFPLGQISLVRRPFWSDDVAAAIKHVNDFINSLAGEQVIVLDTAAVLANQGGMVDPAYARDFLHLNEKGYEALNIELVRILGR